MPIFFIFYLFHRLVLIRVHFSCSNFAAWWLEREVVWRLSCFCSCTGKIVVRVKVSREIVTFFQWGSTVWPTIQRGELQGQFTFFYIFWRAWVCWPPSCFCRPFRIFERCLRIRAQISVVASRRATNLATHLIRTQIQITQPGSSTVVKLCANRGDGRRQLQYYYSFYFAILYTANTIHTQL